MPRIELVMIQTYKYFVRNLKDLFDVKIQMKCI